MVGLLRLRFAGSVCVLAAGLLMGAGARVAVADPGSSGSAAHGDDGTNASGAKKPKDAAGGTRTARLARAGNQASRLPPARRARWARAGDQASSLPPARQAPRQSPRFRTRSRRFLEVAVAPVSDVVAPVSEVAVAPVSEVVAGFWWWRRFLRWWRRFLRWRWRRFRAAAPVSDVSALVQDMLTSVAGAGRPAHATAVRPLFLLLGIAGVAPVSDVIALVQDMLRSVVDAVVLLAQLPSTFFPSCWASPGAARRGRIGRHRRPWAVGSRGWVGGVAIAAGPAVCGYLGPATCRYFGPAVGRQRSNRGRNARCECGRSSVSGVRDGTASARRRKSDGCAVVFPACFQRTPATRFTVGAGRWRFARRRRVCDHCPGRGARGIPPGQSRCRIAHNGHRAFRPFGAARYRPPDGIARRPSEGIARRPSRGVKRRTSSDKVA
jgi:hypothetical protein